MRKWIFILAALAISTIGCKKQTDESNQDPFKDAPRSNLPDELAPLSIVHHSAEELASFLTALKDTEKMAYREAAIHNAKRFDLSHLQKQAPLLIWAPVGS